jgi:hypothetical protein
MRYRTLPVMKFLYTKKYTDIIEFLPKSSCVVYL